MPKLILIASLLLFNVCATYGQSSLCRDLDPALPTFSKFIKAKKDKFIKDQGPVRTQNVSDKNLAILCKQNAEPSRRLFNDKEMFPFVIDNSCQLIFAEKANGKTYVPHTVLAAERTIVSGGLIQCLHRKSGPEQFYISNKSSRYCFDFEHMKFAIESLKKAGVAEQNIWLKPKSAKFCKNKKSRVAKYKDIIQGKFRDLGYKKSHTYRADNFLKLFQSK